MQNVTNLSGAPEITPENRSVSTPANDGQGDFETFLTLLTAQMRNQDPLKPMDATAFVAQLATFSSVEQQILTNTKLESLISQVSQNATFGLSNWLGKEVGYNGKVAFFGEPVKIDTPVEQGADAAVLVVRDMEGQEVERISLSPDTRSIYWPVQNGVSGTPDHGNYRTEVTSLRNGSEIGTRPASISSEVIEVRVEDGNASLVLANGVAISADKVTSVGFPGP